LREGKKKGKKGWLYCNSWEKKREKESWEGWGGGEKEKKKVVFPHACQNVWKERHQATHCSAKTKEEKGKKKKRVRFPIPDQTTEEGKGGGDKKGPLGR